MKPLQGVKCCENGGNGIIFILAFLPLAGVMIIPGGVIPPKNLQASQKSVTNPGSRHGGRVKWVQPSHESTGNYYMYDDDEDGPPFEEPILPELPEFLNLPDIDGSVKLAPYNDLPFEYSLPDSFWYFGHWYEPGDKLYFSPDGWVSFDPSSDPGFPNPPGTDPVFPNADAPNAVIAPLWQDINNTIPVEPTDNDRQWYLYDEANQLFYAQWHNVLGDASGETYRFQVVLHLGGQDKLIDWEECGIAFSSHFIEFLYDHSSDWSGDNGATGLEDQTGEHGITYGGTIVDGRKIRAGYKKTFTHDVRAVTFLQPGSMWLRYTPVEPRVVVENIGTQTETFAVTVEIYDEDLVFDYSWFNNSLAPGDRDTFIAPCWTPGEIGTMYEKYAFTYLVGDDCRHNDTVMMETCIHCDDTLRYWWNEADWQAYALSPGQRVLTSYGVDDGLLVTGGRGWISSLYGASPAPVNIEVYEAENGCGPTNPSMLVAQAACPSIWNYAQFEEPGVWLNSASPGNIWAGMSPIASPSGYYSEFGMADWPAPSARYSGQGPGRGGHMGPAFSWGGRSGDFYTPRVELFAHLGFGEYPCPVFPEGPPCYYEQPHDLTCYEMVEPAGQYVEADVPINPVLSVANIGRQPEPGSGYFPVTFMAVDEATLDTVFRDSVMVSQLGWPGDDADGPDTLIDTLPAWTPEGLCDDYEPFVYYELIGLVRLGEVGPDESDHCPYNDTVRSFVMSLLTHDVGVTAIALDPEPDEPPDIYNPGTGITATATVENFGFNAEHNFEVRLEVFDCDSDYVRLWHNLQLVTFLDWRGNSEGNPYRTDVVFPVYTVMNDHRQGFEARTELVGDMCPDDDYKIIGCRGCISEINQYPKEFSIEVHSTQAITDLKMRFTVPHPSWVKIDVFAINGRWVKSIVNNAYQPGVHHATWDGCDRAGRKVAAGIYLVHMKAEDFKAVRKVVLLD